MKYFIPLIALFSLIACQQENTSLNGQNCSTIQMENGMSVLQNFYFKNLGDGKVIAISKSEKLNTEEIPVYQIQPVLPKEDSAKWSIDFSSNDFSVIRDLLFSETIVEGKDASYKVFSLVSGEEVIQYTYDKFEVLFSDENEKRLIGFYSNNAATLETSDFDFSDNSLGFFSYSNSKGLISQVRINGNNEWANNLDVSDPVIELLALKENALELNSGKTLYFTSTDGKEKKKVNFDIQITFYSFDTYEPYTFILQVRNDELLIQDGVFSNEIFQVETI